MSIRFILDRPAHPGNIVAVARNVVSLGTPELRLVRPCLQSRIDYRLGVADANLFEKVTVFADLRTALADCAFVVGTTARLGGWRKECVAIREAVPWILRESRLNDVAILFGCEKWGLDNETISQCDLLVTIPVTEDQKSLNLAQAVLLIGYELRVNEENSELPLVKRAAWPRFRAFADALREALESVDYFTRGIPEYWLAKVLQPFSRRGLTEAEVDQALALFARLRAAIRRSNETELKQ